MKVGFIGLGIMGRPMVKNLLKAGYDVTVYSRRPSHVEAMVKAGAQSCGSICEVAQWVDVLFTMVQNSPNVEDILFGEGRAVDGLKPGSVVIDCSSINPIQSRSFAARLAEKGIEMLDAPVSGGEPKAIDGTLAFMVGGKREVFEKHKALLGSMGSSVVLCGDVGAGNVTKLCNQIIVAVNIASLAEALMLGQLAGVDPNRIYEAIRGGLAGSVVMDAKAIRMMDNDFEPGGRLELHNKDLNNVVEAARSVDAPIPLTLSVLEMMKVLHRSGDFSLDHCVLLKYYQLLAGEALHR